MDDPVARFLTILGMMSNDLLRLVSWLIDDDEGDENDRAGERVFSFRLQASAFFEASKFMRESVPRWPEINDFITGLPDEAREQLQRVAGSTDPSSDEYVGEWIEKHRNVTFHYSEMHPERAAAGKEEISTALAEAADIPTEIELGEIQIRCAFHSQTRLQSNGFPMAKTQHPPSTYCASASSILLASPSTLSTPT